MKTKTPAPPGRMCPGRQRSPHTWAASTIAMVTTMMAALIATMFIPLAANAQSTQSLDPAPDAQLSWSRDGQSAGPGPGKYPYMWASQEIKIYAKPGEYLHGRIELGPFQAGVDEIRFTMALIGPDGTIVRQKDNHYTTETNKNRPLLFSFPGRGGYQIPANGEGIYTLKPINADPNLPPLSLSHHLGWMMVSQTDTPTAGVAGRIWTEELTMRQRASDIRPVGLHYHNDKGALYEAYYRDYNGIDSRLSADALGLAYNGERDGATEIEQDRNCQPTYKSLIDDRLAGLSSESLGERYYQTSAECDTTRYRLYLNGAPDPTMPATARDGELGAMTWLNPTFEAASISGLAYTTNPDTLTHTNPVSVTVNQQGSVVFTVRAGDSPTSPVLGTVTRSLNAGTHQVQIFDELDGISRDQQLHITAELRNINEIHFINTDAERRAGGIEVLQKVGTNPGDKTIYWDDTSVNRWEVEGTEIYNIDTSDPMKCYADFNSEFTVTDCTTPNPDTTNTLSALNGVDSTGGVHSWVGLANPLGSWGNVRAIDDWTYMSAAAAIAITAPGVALTPGIELVKSNDTGGATLSVGDEVVYTFIATNTGQTVLNNVRIDDPMLTARGIMVTPARVDNVQPGQEVVFTSEAYTILPEDLGSALTATLTNTATVTGEPPSGTPVTDEDSNEVPIAGTPGMSLVKTGSTSGPVAQGDQITYTFEVTNTGDVFLSDVSISDEMLEAAGVAISPATQDIGVGRSVIFTSAPYTVTAADVTNGSVDNVAIANGTDPDDNPVISNEDDWSVPVEGTPAIDLVKTVDNQGPVQVGDELVYTFTVTNTGSLDLTNVRITDDMLDVAGVAITPASVDLPVGESTTFTSAPYTVTEADVVAGLIENTATVTGTPPTGDDVTDTDEVEVPTEGSPAISLVKTGSTEGPVREGETIVYTFVVTNDGPLTVTDISISDQMLEAAGVAISPAVHPALAPGDSVTFTSEPYTVTAADVVNGSVDNVAVANGTGPGDEPVTSNEDDWTVPVTSEPGINLVKTANTAGPVQVGDEVVYTFTATNTGDVVLNGVTITDDMLEAAGVAITPASVDGLEPGQETVFTSAPYTVTEADLAAGEVFNTATVTGNPPTGDPVTDTDDEQVPVEESLVEFTVLKRDMAGTALAGAEFTLTDADGAAVAGVTGSDGRYTFTQLSTGTYTLVETRAPAGHNLLPGAITLVVNADGIEVQDGDDSLVAVDGDDPWLLLVNNTNPVVLPSTGGAGLGLAGAGLAGLLLLAAGAYTLINRRKAA